jgi:hypothetical protein
MTTLLTGNREGALPFPERPRLPLAAATALATGAAVGAMAAAAICHAGLASWLDGAIYLLAAVPLALGLRALLRHRWRHDASAKRRGLVFLIVAWALAVEAWTSVKGDRAALAARERRLEPVVEALARYRYLHGAYPVSLAALGDQGRLPLRAHVYYTEVLGGSYLLSFRHDLVVEHRFNPERGVWIDTL